MHERAQLGQPGVLPHPLCLRQRQPYNVLQDMRSAVSAFLFYLLYHDCQLIHQGSSREQVADVNVPEVPGCNANADGWQHDAACTRMALG